MNIKQKYESERAENVSLRLEISRLRDALAEPCRCRDTPPSERGTAFAEMIIQQERANAHAMVEAVNARYPSF